MLPEIGIRFIDALPPSPPEIIPGFLPAEGVTYLTGPTNIGKSLVAIEVASALTTHTPLWGCLAANQTIDRVVYVLGEHTTSTVHRLYHVTGLPMGTGARIIGPEQLPEQKYLVGRGELDLDTLDQYRHFTQGAELIIVDPLAAFISGVNAENDNAAMRHLIDGFSLLGQENHCPVLILGHFGKPIQDSEGNEKHRTSYASRGASGAEDACPTVFYMREDEGQTYRIHCRKGKSHTPPDRLLVRNAATKVHTMLTSNRPHVEAKRVEFRQRVEKMLAGGLEKTPAIQALAALDGISESTAWRYIREDG